MADPVSPDSAQDNLTKDAATEGTWFDSLHEDYKSEKSLDKFSKDPDGLNNIVKSYLHLEKRMGNAINLPGDNATAEEVSDFRKKLGIPESPDGYTLKHKEHDALKFDENMDKAWKAKAHEIGLTPKQAQALTDYYSDIIIGADEARTRQYQESEDFLKQKYGNNYQKVLDKANNVLRTFANEKDMENLKPFENDVRLVELFSNIADSMSEHSFKRGDGVVTENTKAETLKKVEELRSIYLDPNKPPDVRKEADKEAQELLNKIYTGEVSSSSDMKL